MRFLVLGLLQICRLSLNYPRAMMAAFVALSMAGFCAVPFIRVSSDIMSGVGRDNPNIRLTLENSSIFGEQDALILVLEFPEPPGEIRLPFIRDLSEYISQLPGIHRVRYRFMDPEDHEQAAQLLQRFLLGMNSSERQEIHRIFSVQGITDALRRTRNRLFLTENAYLQERLLEDPLEIGQFVARSMEKRVGSLNLGDPYLLIASPDSTLYLIQITPEFPSTEVGRGKELLDLLHNLIPDKISQLTKTIPGIPERSRDIKWYLDRESCVPLRIGHDFRPRNSDPHPLFVRFGGEFAAVHVPQLLVRGRLDDSARRGNRPQLRSHLSKLQRN